MSFQAHPSNQSHFAMAPSVGFERSQFNLSQGHKTTIYADKLYPLYVGEVLPGDMFNTDQTIYARLATPIAPIMDALYLDTFWFFVPNRLVWSDWVKFMGEKDDPEDTTEYTVPKIRGLGERDSLWDHFGCPDCLATITVDHQISALPYRAYSKIYDDWFRDQNLIEKVLTDIGSGPDEFGDHPVQKRAKRHDYFTSALPWPQKGDAVELPLGTTAPVYGTGKSLGLTDGINNLGISQKYSAVGQNDLYQVSQAYNKDVGQSWTGTPTINYDGVSIGVVESGVSGLYVKLSDATAATINSLREAFQLQRLLERDARSGTRYVEVIKAHWGVTSPDFRLQRSEYLGGSTQMVNMSPVTQMSAKATADSTQTPLGTVGGVGTAIQRSGFSKSFTEHGWVICIVNLRSNVTYQQGLNRMFTRSSKYDFPWPALMHLGEQEVQKREIFFSGDPVVDAQTWAYQERYAECRYSPSIISGKFRSTDSAPLDVWHLAEEFASCPAFNASFMEANSPMFRVLAVPGTQQEPLPHMYIDAETSIKAARVMPTYSVPGLIDHF